MRQALHRIQEFGQLRARVARLESRLEHSTSGGRPRIRTLRRLIRVLEALRRLEDRLEIDMADLLLELHEHHAWVALGYTGLEAYAEERLGMGGSTARKRVGLARQLRPLPVVRNAYAKGKVGLEAAQHVEAALRGRSADSDLQALWVEHARTTTIKRLRSERRLQERERLVAIIGIAKSMTGKETAGPTARRSPLPPDDSTWQRSLRLVPGDTRMWAIGLGYELLQRVVRDGPLMNVPLAIELPADAAAEFLGCVESARRALGSSQPLSPADESRLRPSARIAHAFVRRDQRVPEWVGLLALLEEWVLTYDEPEHEPNRSIRRILERDGYRCAAPGCTARARLQVHHIDHRAHGGGNEDENRVTLCLFHHMLGEHGGLARVRGRAPLEVVWRLGAQGLGQWFRNETRLTGPR